MNEFLMFSRKSFPASSQKRRQSAPAAAPIFHKIVRTRSKYEIAIYPIVLRIFRTFNLFFLNMRIFILINVYLSSFRTWWFLIFPTVEKYYENDINVDGVGMGQEIYESFSLDQTSWAILRRKLTKQILRMAKLQKMTYID